MSFRQKETAKIFFKMKRVPTFTPQYGMREIQSLELQQHAEKFNKMLSWQNLGKNYGLHDCCILQIITLRHIEEVKTSY